MRILLVTSDYPAMPGGVADYSYHFAHALADRGVRVGVLTSQDPRIVSSDTISVFPRIRRWSISAFPAILDVVRDFDPDVISLQYVPYMYSHFGMPLHLMAIGPLLLRPGRRLVTTFHETAVLFDLYRPQYWPVFASQRAVAFALAVWSHTIVAALDVARVYPTIFRPFRSKLNRIAVGSNILPVSFSPEERESLRAQYAVPGDRIIATFGLGAACRRSDLLLDAIALLKAGGRQMHLLVIGDMGETHRPLARGIRDRAQQLGLTDRVHFTGYLQSADVYRHLRLADVLAIVDTGPFAGVSMRSGTIAAAWAARIPVLTNAGPLADELMRHGETAYLIHSVAPESIARGLAALLDDVTLRDRLVAGASAAFRAHLSWQTIAEQYLQALEISSSG
jgi:glycosyltransferase involved in cell wall biosynthesis